MRLSPFNYYVDFFISLALVVALLVGELVLRGTLLHGFVWFNYVAGGFAIWTLFEYLVHRILYHHVPYFHELHDAHHAEPNAFIGAPPVIGPAMILAAGLAISYTVGSSIAGGVTSGLLIGYCGYMLVHHASHHWNLPTTSWLYSARRHHALHHHYSDGCNFGIITSFWDHVFGTARVPRTREPGKSQMQ